MSRPTVLACDLGTSACKVALVDAAGNVLASASEPVGTVRPASGWAEQDPEAWWAACRRGIAAVLERTGCAPDAVGVVGQMSAWLGLDAEHRPVAPALIWADLRAADEAGAIARRVGAERVFEITGNRVGPTYPLARWLWLRRHAPEAEARARLLVQPKDYLVGRLSGSWGTDPSDASCTLAYDLLRGAWSTEILDALELPAGRLPVVRPSAAIVGGVTAEAAAQTGLLAGTPVVAGGGDGPAAALGTGVIDPGEAYLNFGTSAWISQAAIAPVTDATAGVVSFAHVVPGRYAVTASTQNAGATLDWALRSYAPREVEGAAGGQGDFAAIEARLRAVPAGADGLLFLPHLQGERTPYWDPSLRGAMLGLAAHHDRWFQLRAVYEGVGHQLCELLDALAASGPRPASLRLIGGGGRSDLLPALIADALGIPLWVAEGAGEATGLGAARLAAAGVGIVPDLRATREWLPRGARVETGPDGHVYERAHPRWREAVVRLAGLASTGA